MAERITKSLAVLDSYVLSPSQRAEIAARRAVVKPEEVNPYPQGYLKPEEVVARRRLLGAVGYVMGQPKRYK